jgi:hypothetical protein
MFGWERAALFHNDFHRPDPALKPHRTTTGGNLSSSCFRCRRGSLVLGSHNFKLMPAVPFGLRLFFPPC